MESTQEESTEGLAVVRVLATVLDRLVKSNSHINNNDPSQVTKFHALQAPGIDILHYLERIHKYASCSTECYILALIYIDRLIQRNNFNLSGLNVHRVVITAVLLAAKFFDDAYYNNAYYAKVGGVLVSEMNGLEVEFLFRINFSLHVKPEVFRKYQAELVSHALPPQEPFQNEAEHQTIDSHQVTSAINTCAQNSAFSAGPEESYSTRNIIKSRDTQDVIIESTSSRMVSTDDYDWCPKAYEIRRHITPSPTQTINYATNPSVAMFNVSAVPDPMNTSCAPSHMHGNSWSKFEQSHQGFTSNTVKNSVHHIHQPLTTMLQYATTTPSSPHLVTATTEMVYR